MEVERNFNSHERIHQENNNENFAEFLSENLGQSGISQREISYLLNLIPNPAENPNRGSIASSISSVNSFYESDVARLSMINSNISKKSTIDNQADMNVGMLSDFSEAPVINNRKSRRKSSKLRNSNKSTDAAPDLKNIITKEYENGLYQGEMQNGKREGRGMMYYNSGDKYEGEYKNDQKNGKGIYISDEYKYKGDFKNGLRDGKGAIEYKTGDKYEGEWAEDQYNGKGLYTFKDGSKYNGTWRNNQPNGFGVFEYANGEKYEGDFKNNIKDGYGKYYYENGNRYEGQYVNDKQEGVGTMFFNNGDKYIGNFKEEQMEGNGTYYFSNGDRYEGEISQNISNGIGI